jgi:hypothetical protein
MSALEIGQRLVRLCKDGKFEEAVESLYGDNIVSIEAQDMGDKPARMEGIEAIRGKNEWWINNHETHSMAVAGPYCGHRQDQFAVEFQLDVTNKPSGERSQMREVALYTVDGDKIVQEEFLYLMG